MPASTVYEKHKENEVWEDEEYVKEMNRRFRDYETGKIKGFTLDEVEACARQTYKLKRNNNAAVK